jgi:hypothetical protein
VRESIGDIGSKAAEIEFVEADLNSDASWSQAAIGAQYVLHVASDFLSGEIPSYMAERRAGAATGPSLRLIVQWQAGLES